MAFQAYQVESNLFDRYLKEDGSGIYLTETSVGEAAAGRSKARQERYILRIDGQEFTCRDLNEAWNLIEQAKALARKISQERLRAATASKKATRLPTPKIEGSEALKGVVIEAAKEIKEIYRKANVDIELIALLHQQSLRDQDEELMWLM